MDAKRFVRVQGTFHPDCGFINCNPLDVVFLALWNWESEALRLFQRIDFVSVVD